MKFIILLVLFLLDFASSSCNPPCVNGICVDESQTCDCVDFYEGNDCSIHWSSVHKHWTTYWYIYITYTIILFAALSGFAGFQLVTIFYTARKNKSSPWSYTTIFLFGIITGTLLQTIHFMIDPHNYFHRIPVPEEQLLSAITIWIELSMAYLLFLYWLELLYRSKLQQLQFVRKFRLVLIIVIILIALTFLPTIFVASYSSGSRYVYYFLNGELFLFILGLVLMSAISGFRFLRLLKNIWTSTKERNIHRFYQKTTITLLVAVGMFILLLITLPILTIVRDNPWVFVTLLWLARTEEFGAVLSFLILVQKKKPESTSENADREGQDISVNMSTADTFE